MAALGLNRSRLINLFSEVDRELGEGDRPVDVLVVGGAAIALQWHDERLTNDVDVVSEGLSAAFREAVRRVGERHGLGADWINDAAKVKAPSPHIDPEPSPLYRGERLRVYGAGARYVLAMKLVAGREIDLADIPLLLRAAGMASREELLELVEGAYPSHLIPAKPSTSSKTPGTPTSRDSTHRPLTDPSHKPSPTAPTPHTDHHVSS